MHGIFLVDFIPPLGKDRGQGHFIVQGSISDSKGIMSSKQLCGVHMNVLVYCTFSEVN